MKKTITHITKTLLQNQVWVFGTLLFGVSYIMTQISQQLKGKDYLNWLLMLGILFAPPLILVYFRKELQAYLSPKMYNLLRGALFIIYPTQISFFQLDQTLFDKFGVLNGELKHLPIIPIVASLFLGTEIVLMISEMKQQSKQIKQWLIQVSLTKWMLFFLIIFSLLLTGSSNLLQEKISSLSLLSSIGYFIYYTAQILLIFGSYYIFYYLHHHVIFNQLFRKKGIIYYVFGIVALLLILTPIHNFIISLFSVVHDLKIHPTGFGIGLLSSTNFILPTTILLLSTPFIIVTEWYKQAHTVAELEKEKTNTELHLLKQQINPHFFFNTLNNLYSMSLIGHKETPETIMQLSELMRYVIYKGKEEQVALSEELKYIKDYIQLQKIRLHKNVDFQWEEDLLNPSIQIAPLLFIIQVENAFKHGIEPAEEASFLHIKVKQTADDIQFICHNSVEEKEEKQSPGIGLLNLKKRLAILYPQQHQLENTATQNDFHSTLSIQL